MAVRLRSAVTAAKEAERRAEDAAEAERRRARRCGRSAI